MIQSEIQYKAAVAEQSAEHVLVQEIQEELRHREILLGVCQRSIRERQAEIAEWEGEPRG